MPPQLVEQPEARTSAAAADVQPEDLQRLPFLAALEPAALAALMHCATVVRLPEGTKLFRQGEPGGTLHLVVRGAVAVQAVVGDRLLQGLVDLGPGELCGELSWLRPAPHTATAVAREATVALAWDRAALAALLREQPAVERALLTQATTTVSERLRRMTARYGLAMERAVSGSGVAGLHLGAPVIGPVDLDLQLLTGTMVSGRLVKCAAWGDGQVLSLKTGPDHLTLIPYRQLETLAASARLPASRPDTRGDAAAGLFAGLSAAETAAVQAAMVSRRLDAGATLFDQGDAGGTMFVVTAGLIEIAARLGDNSRQPLAQLGPGGVFGELSLFTRTPRSAAAFARQPTTVLALDTPSLERLLQAEPAAGLCILRHLTAVIGGRLQQTTLCYREALEWVLDVNRLAPVDFDYLTVTPATVRLTLVSGGQLAGRLLPASSHAPGGLFAVQPADGAARFVPHHALAMLVVDVATLGLLPGELP